MTLLHTSRLIPATAEQIFAAVAAPERLARWWGPSGFRNTFETFEFKTGGRWTFVMHGPDGTNYPNENVFALINAPHKVVIDHVCEPFFRLSITLTPSGAGTCVDWEQVFADPAVAERFRAICAPANEQNLDRLTAEVLG